jgi:hypothetical protein
MIRKMVIAIGLSLGLSVSVSFVAQPATAASSDAIAQALVGATLENLGLEELSEELCAGLVGQLTDAIEAGVIDPDISAQVARLLENPAMMSGLADVFDAHLDGQTSSWKTSALLNTDSTGVRGGDDASDSNRSQDSNGINEGPRDGSFNNSFRRDDSDDLAPDTSRGGDSNDPGRDEPSDSGKPSEEDNGKDDEGNREEDGIEDDVKDDSKVEDDSVDERRRPVL